jgi:hypothetical protein
MGFSEIVEDIAAYLGGEPVRVLTPTRSGR